MNINLRCLWIRWEFKGPDPEFKTFGFWDVVLHMPGYTHVRGRTCMPCTQCAFIPLLNKGYSRPGTRPDLNKARLDGSCLGQALGIKNIMDSGRA